MSCTQCFIHSGCYQSEIIFSCLSIQNVKMHVAHNYRVASVIICHQSWSQSNTYLNTNICSTEPSLAGFNCSFVCISDSGYISGMHDVYRTNILVMKLLADNTKPIFFHWLNKHGIYTSLKLVCNPPIKTEKKNARYTLLSNMSLTFWCA